MSAIRHFSKQLQVLRVRPAIKGCCIARQAAAGRAQRVRWMRGGVNRPRRSSGPAYLISNPIENPLATAARAPRLACLSRTGAGLSSHGGRVTSNPSNIPYAGNGARASAGFSRPQAVQRLAATEGGCSAARRCADHAEKYADVHALQRLCRPSRARVSRVNAAAGLVSPHPLHALDSATAASPAAPPDARSAKWHPGMGFEDVNPKLNLSPLHACARML